MVDSVVRMRNLALKDLRPDKDNLTPDAVQFYKIADAALSSAKALDFEPTNNK